MAEPADASAALRVQLDGADGIVGHESRASGVIWPGPSYPSNEEIRPSRMNSGDGPIAVGSVHAPTLNRATTGRIRATRHRINLLIM